ncbi:uncharacterized protein HaLaN_28987, partial [Haematococcus lacustris]
MSNLLQDTKAMVLRALVVDTLGLSRKFEAGGLSRAQAEQLAEQITELIIINKVKMEE